MTAPAAASAPSVFTAIPMADPATIGWSIIVAVKTGGRITSSITAYTTTRAETITGISGLALTAPPVATAAETPQMEIADASTADIFLGNLKSNLAIAYVPGQNIRYATAVAAAPVTASSKTKSAAFMAIYPTLTPKKTMAVLIYHSGLAASLKNAANFLKKFPMTRPTINARIYAAPPPSDRLYDNP